MNKLNVTTNINQDQLFTTKDLTIDELILIFAYHDIFLSENGPPTATTKHNKLLI